MNIIDMATGGIPISDSAREALERNLDEAMGEDGPLGLRMRELPVMAKDTERGLILEGGFGPFGIGTMWVPLEPYHHMTKAEWDSLPERSSVGGFGGPKE
ncbi:MAG: hypothetical protein M0R22_10890 [Dehalococcoidia bacterium]|nr:hypothetical protein [Dehalococcoidia bacterium]